MSLAAIHWINAACIFCMTAARKCRPAERYINGNCMHIRVALQESRNLHLIFFRCKGACRVDHSSSWFQTCIGIVKDLFLQRSTVIDELLTPLSARFFVFTHHAFPRAWCITEHSIKKSRKGIGCMFCIAVQHHGIGSAAALDVFQQNAGSFGIDFIGDKQACVVQHLGDLGAFGARCCAKIQYFHAFFRMQNGDGCGSTWLLHIKQSCYSCRGSTKAGFPMQIIPIFRKRGLFFFKMC